MALRKCRVNKAWASSAKALHWNTRLHFRNLSLLDDVALMGSSLQHVRDDTYVEISGDRAVGCGFGAMKVMNAT
jgi:hypothetical protein